MSIKNISMVVLVLAVLAPPVLAVPENITLGPYQVSFDMGLGLHKWNFTEKSTETYSGIPYTGYMADNESLTIYVYSFSTNDSMYWNLNQLKSKWELSMLRDVCSCDTFNRIIDKKEGFVARTECHRGIGYLPATFYAEWHDEKTKFALSSTCLWDEGTLQLLKTIHIEKVNGSMAS